MMDKWLEEFRLWNKVHNLMSHTESDNLDEHVADSLSLIPFLEGAPLIVDIGSGGGFPVIPLAIWAKENRPELKFIATDVIDKKIAFLKLCRAKFGLNIDVVKVERSFYVEEPCIICSRAFANVKLILQWTALHTADCRGWLLLKGQKAEEELARAKVKDYEIIPNPRGFIIRFGFKESS